MRVHRRELHQPEGGQFSEESRLEDLAVPVRRPDRERPGVTGFDEFALLVVEFERVGLPDRAVDLDVLQRPWADLDVGVLEGVLLAAEEQVGFAVGVDVEVLLDRIEVVRPVVDPVAVAEGGFEVPGRLLEGDREELVGLDRQPAVLDDRGGEKSTRGERVFERLFDGVRTLDQLEDRLAIVGFDKEAIALQHQRVVAVGLEEVHVGDDVEVLDAGFQPDVLPAVLEDVPEVAVPWE